MMLSTVFFSQMGIGVIGNSFLISLFTFMFLSGHRLRPIDTIFTQLTLANCLVLLSKGIPQAMVALGLTNFMDITGCKMTLFLQRVARGLTLTLTCLLSGFWVITISPSNLSSDFKARATKNIIPICLLSWIFHLLLNSFILIEFVLTRDSRNTTAIQHYGYCSHLVPSGSRAFLFAFILSFPDAVYVGLMILTSGCIIRLLYRHHKQVKQIHMNCSSTRAFPETRATKTVLLLVSTFVSTYSIDCILEAYISFMKSPTWLVHASSFLFSFYPAISPYVLISSDSKVPKYCYALCGRKPTPTSTVRAGQYPVTDDLMKAPERRNYANR